LVNRHVVGGRTRAGAEYWVDVVDEPNAALIAGTEADCDRTLYIDEGKERDDNDLRVGHSAVSIRSAGSERSMVTPLSG
jgi:hypothetical protein